MPLTSNEMSVESDDMRNRPPRLIRPCLMARRLTPRHRANRMPKCCSSRTVFPTSMTSGSSRRCTERTIREFLGKHAGATSESAESANASGRQRTPSPTCRNCRIAPVLRDWRCRRHSLHSPAKFQSDVRRQATPDPRLHRGGRLRARQTGTLVLDEAPFAVKHN